MRSQLRKRFGLLLIAVFVVLTINNSIAQGTCQIYGPGSVCANTPTFFSSDCLGNSFSWAIDNQVMGNGGVFEYTFSSPGTYLVTLYYGLMEDPGGPIQMQQQLPPSSGRTDMYVTVLSSPVIPVIQTNNAEICNSGSVTLSVANIVQGITYTWHSIPSGYSGTGTTQTFNNVSTSREFFVTASNGSCTSQSSRTVNVVTTEITPQLDLTVSYRKRIIRGSAYGYDHYWQRTVTGTEIIKSVTGDYTVTEEGQYYIRKRSTAGNCWTTATGPINVTVGLIPPKPIVVQAQKSGYNEILFMIDDKDHVLTYADYYWVSNDSPNPQITGEYIVNNVLAQNKIYQNGTYYLKGRDRATGTWGNVLTLNVMLRDDGGLNWIHTKLYDGSQVPITISESKSYFDQSGNSLQSQSKNMESGHVFATQNVKDKYDRVVGSTLPAPILGNDFRFNEGFSLGTDNKQYSPDNFDTPEKKYNPDEVGNVNPGTLGWYYSENNTLEPNVGKTNYPYSRTEFYEDGTGEVKRAGAPGDYHRLGVGHEPLTGTFPVHNELDDYYTKRLTATGIAPTGQLSKGIQTVGRDANGKYGVSITDKEGNTVMTARAGKQNPGEYMLKVDNVAIGNADVSSSNCRKMIYFYILESQPVNIAVTGATPNTIYYSDIVKDSFDPSKNIYVAGKEIRLLPGFTVSASAGQTLHGRVEQASGGWSVENLLTGERLPVYGTFADTNGNWPAGFYRIVVHSGEVTVSYTNYFQDVSYQFYDDAGRLKTSVSPNGFKKWVENSNPTVNFPSIDKTTYQYNARGWLLSMTEPDAGTTTYRYRRDGKIRFSQNAQQANDSRFSYTHYDRLGRPVQSGEYKGTGDSYATVGTQLEFATQQIFPAGDVKDWVKTYYDVADPNLTTQTGLPNIYVQEFLRSAVSYTENENMKTWYSYDELGRVVWMAQKPKALNRTFVSVYTYDFLGNVLTAGNLSYVNGNLTSQFYHHYEYDKDKRLSKALTSLDGGEDKKLRAVYKYYLHGPLKRVELGGGIQGIDFVYNIHGWLTQINHPSLDATKDPGRDGAPESNFRKDAFGMAIDYYESEMEGLFPVAMNMPQHKAPELFHNLPGAKEKGNSQQKETEERLAWMDIKPVVKNTQINWVSQVSQINDYLATNHRDKSALGHQNQDMAVIEGSNLNLLPQPVVEVESEEVMLANLTIDESTLTASVNNQGLITVEESPLGLVDDALEFAALKALYDSLGGVNWTNKTGWPTAGNWPASATPAQMAAWRGITVTNGDITAISLGSNNLIGKIPAAIQNLTALKTLALNNNSITGKIPVWLGSMTSLETLYLYTNQLTGGIPASLGNLSALKILGLQSNPLGGTIPASLGSLTNLQTLFLQAAQLTGPIPSSFSNLVKLRELNLATNSLTGVIPDLSSLTELTNINMYSLPNLDPAPVPSWVGQLTKLVSLSFENAKRNGTIPTVGNLVNLKTLNLASNQLIGNIPVELGNLTKLESLYLQGNQLTGNIPAEISGMEKLKIFRTNTNQLSGTIPPSLYTLTELTNLQLYGNQFTGVISAEIGNLAKLVTLDISSNNFSGNIPVSIGNLTLMQNLILTSNQFTGILPPGILNMPNLKLLYVANNQLEGEIPDLGSLVNIQNIAFQNNKFTGSIGSWIGSLVKMLTFRIDNNKFTSLDPAILQLPLLQNVYLNGNELTAIPAFHTYFNKANLNLYAANNFLDFSDLEPLYGGGAHGIKLFSYSPQKKFNSPAKLHVPAGEIFELAAQPKGDHSTVTWQKQNGASWISMNATNEDNTQQTYTITGATAAINGTYRWRMTNTQMTGLTLESTPVEITVVDALPDQTGSGALFNGIISSVRWSTQAPVGSEQGNELTGMYRYTYDDKYQVTEANWAEPNYVLNTFTEADNKYRVTNLNYDPNGNIKNLTRYDKDALRTDNFTYGYDDPMRVNKLTSVSGYTSNYTYNAIGQMTGADKVTGDDQYIEYDVSGKVRKVFKDAAKTQLATEYLYDDRGFRLVKITPTSGQEVRCTWYIRDASGNVVSIYEQDGEPALTNTNAFTQTEVPVYGAGKLGTYYASQDGSMVYELTDHLGNVRALVREDVNIYTATMEDSGIEELANPRVQEMQYFENLFETEVTDVNANHTPGGSRAAYLNWAGGTATAHKAIGPGIVLKVNAGDTIRAEVWARFENKVSFSRNLGLVAMAQLLGGSFAYTGVFESSTFGQATTAFNDALLSAGFGGTGNDEEKPFAYLNYMLFNDDDMTSEDSGWIQVPEAAGFDVGQLGQHAKVAFEAPIVAQQSGYIYIWVSNESEGAKVWFDDLKVTHTQTLVTQATDYGVWGDVLREMKAAEITYRHGYQGQFAEKDDETGWNHFELREYDPVIGRWTAIDPYRQYWSPYMGMGNNPANGTDPDGGWDWFVNHKTGSVLEAPGKDASYANELGSDWGWLAKDGAFNVGNFGQEAFYNWVDEGWTTRVWDRTFSEKLMTANGFALAPLELIRETSVFQPVNTITPSGTVSVNITTITEAWYKLTYVNSEWRTVSKTSVVENFPTQFNRSKWISRVENTYKPNSWWRKLDFFAKNIYNYGKEYEGGYTVHKYPYDYSGHLSDYFK